MGYRFRKKDRSVAHGLRRIAREQIDRGIAAVDAPGNRADAIHEVRTRCKKLRALLRIVRPAFEGYDVENGDFRDTARLLGGAREAAVLVETFDRLIRRYPQVDEQGRTRLRQALQARGTDEPSEENLLQARERLIAASARVRRWSLAADEWDVLGPGLMHTLVHARETLHRIADDDSIELRHELRKQVKYHWHHLQLLRSAVPKHIAPRAELSAEVAERLGEYHDLANLETALRRNRAAPDLAAIAALAKRHRLLVEKQALQLARLLLAETAEGVTRRLGTAWSEWRG